MKNAYQRRRVKARVEKRARMKKLDAITLDFARQVIEEETGAPLDIPVSSTNGERPAQSAGAVDGAITGDNQARLVARDDRKNPLISTFDWTADAAQRILRVPAGFMRSQTQERVEVLARERAARVIDLALVEAGIEIGKRMMAEMIANYPSPGTNPGTSTTGHVQAGHSGSAAGSPRPDTTTASGAPEQSPATPAPRTTGIGYLNEVSALPARRSE
jgi:hypothetical protein